MVIFVARFLDTLYGCYSTRFTNFNDSPIKFNFSPPNTGRGTQIRRRIKKGEIPLHRAKNGDYCIPPTQEALYFNGFTAYDLIIPLYQNQLLHR